MTNFDEIVQKNLESLRVHEGELDTTLKHLNLQTGQRCVFVGSGRSLLPLEFAVRGADVQGLYVDGTNVEFQAYLSQRYAERIQSAGGRLSAQYLNIMDTPITEIPSGFHVVHCVGFGGRDADYHRDDFVHTLLALGNEPLSYYLVSKAGGLKGIKDPFAAFLIHEAARLGKSVTIVAPELFVSELNPYEPVPLIKVVK